MLRNYVLGRIAPVATRCAALATAALLVACTAKEPDQRSATVDGTVHVCSSCHGAEGRSVSPTFPRLAGQQKDYLEVQLKAFRDKTRADPHAHTYMWGMAAHLSDDTIAGIANYYAAQAPVAGTPGNASDIAAGKKIFAEGIDAKGVPACMGCHGEHAEGNGQFPRLAGQHREYLEEQLVNFASSARANEIMHENSKNLALEDAHAVAAFLSAQ